MTGSRDPGGTWTPAACTLPTAEQPLRVEEFDELFATAVRGVQRVDEEHLRLTLLAAPSVAARAADLAARETACCGFFAFALHISEANVVLEVSTPPAHTEALTGLAERAGALARS